MCEELFLLMTTPCVLVRFSVDAPVMESTTQHDRPWGACRHCLVLASPSDRRFPFDRFRFTGRLDTSYFYAYLYTHLPAARCSCLPAAHPGFEG